MQLQKKTRFFLQLHYKKKTIDIIFMFFLPSIRLEKI